MCCDITATMYLLLRTTFSLTFNNNFPFALDISTQSCLSWTAIPESFISNECSDVKKT